MALPIPPLDLEALNTPMFFDLNPDTFFEGIEEYDNEEEDQDSKPNEEAAMEKKIESTKQKLHANYDAAAKVKRRNRTQFVSLGNLPKRSRHKSSKINNGKRKFHGKGKGSIAICQY